MTRLSKWQFCQLSRNASESLGSATACSSSLYCRQDALMWSRFERLKERRRGPAESLTLFSNDWFNLLFVWIYLGSYNLLAILTISLIINLKAWVKLCDIGYKQSPTKFWTWVIITICEIKFLFLIFFPRPGNCCFKISWLFQVFHIRTLIKAPDACC